MINRQYAKLVRVATYAVFVHCAVMAQAQIDIGTTDASDGALVVNSNTTLDLSQAANAAWDAPSPVPGKGVYDANKWAVVYKFSSVTINASLNFANHPKGAPVVFLVQGDVSINGHVRLNGANGQN